MEDLYNADTVISFTEEPRSTNSRGVRHIEHGIAIGLCKRTVVVGPRENIYHCLPSVLWFPNYSSFIDGFSEAALESLMFGVQQIEKPDENELKLKRQLIKYNLKRTEDMANVLVSHGAIMTYADDKRQIYYYKSERFLVIFGDNVRKLKNNVDVKNYYTKEELVNDL